MRWQRIIGWTFAGMAILLAVTIAGGYLYLKTSRFERFAIAEIEKQVNRATGGKTQIGGVQLALGSLTIHLYNIELRGREPAGQPPLLHADELTVGLRIVSAVRRQISVREVRIDGLVANVQVDTDGSNNLPTPPQSQSSGQTSIFDLAVEHAQLTKGEIRYNDLKIPLDADMRQFATDIRFETQGKRYIGQLSYNDGKVRYAQYTSFPHQLSLKFSATPEHLNVEPAVFQIGSSRINLQAHISNYSNPVATGAYHIELHAQDFAELLPSIKPAGDLVLSGKLGYHQNAGETVLSAVSVDGQIVSAALSAVSSGHRVEIERLAGNYRLSKGNLAVSDMTLDSLGGSIAAAAEMKHLDGTPESKVAATLTHISLRAVQQVAGQKLPRAVLSGTLGGKAEAAWKGSITNLRTRADMRVSAEASSRSDASPSNVPVHGEVHAIYDGTQQTVELRNTTFAIPSANLTAEGTISGRSKLQLKVIASDLRQLVALASTFSSGPASPLAISGSATLDATVQGSISNPGIAARINADRLGIEGSEWKNARAEIHTNSSGIVIDNASISNARQGQISLRGEIGLKNWSYAESSPVKAQLEVRNIRLSELQALARQNYPVTGDLSANIRLQGSQLQPDGSGKIRITGAQAYGEPIDDLSADFHTENQSIRSKLEIASSAGAIHGTASFTPKTKAYTINIDAPSVVLEKVHRLQEKNIGMTGTVSASLRGEGTLDDPQLTASVRLPKLQVRQSQVTNIEAQVQVAHHQTDLGFESHVAEASLRAHARVTLAGDYQAEGTIDTDTFPLAPILATYAHSIPQEFAGQSELHASFNGPLKDKSRIVAHLSIPVLMASYRSMQIGISKPIRADYANSIITLQPVELTGTRTSLRAAGQIPVSGDSSPTLTAQGSADVQILQIFVPTLQSSGTVALDVRSSGRSVTGQLQFHDVAVATPDAPVGVNKLNGNLNIANNRVQASNMTAEIGGGTVSLGGSLTYSPNVQYNVALQAHTVRLRYPEGLRSLLDANLALTGTTEASTLSGKVLIDSLSFTPDFDLTSFSDQFSTGSAVSQPGFADTVKLAVGVQSQQNLNAVSSQVSISGQAALNVGGTAANPVITGRATLTSGELFFRNVRYQLQRGVITFDNPNETHPVLNVTVNTIIQQYNLNLTLRGPLDKLTTSYVSDPPLATADIINLVARGKTTEEQAASSQSTDSMIASQVAGQLAGSVQKLAGISALEIDPTLGGNSNPSARVAIQQRVSKNLLFSFSTDVSQPGSEIVQGQYQITPRWSVTVQRDQLGGVSVDGKYHSKF